MTITEIGLFIIGLSLGLPTGILMVQWFLDKYRSWIWRNFVAEKVKCPVCGKAEMVMYNSTYCYGCYYESLDKIYKEERKNG